MKDAFGRSISYLRISITDRCNERCVYCMPPDHSDWLPREAILSYEEILAVARVAARFGVRHYRVTGGEPLVRRDVTTFVRRLSGIDGVASLGMTTNATRLAASAESLREAGLNSLNVSLDAVDPGVYARITRGRLDEAVAGLRAARAAGFENIKLNAVLLRGVSEAQIEPLVRFAVAERVAALRFIELMPVSLATSETDPDFLGVEEAEQRLGRIDRLIPLETQRLGHGPARYSRLENLGLVVGFIGAMTDEHFCESCNKVRLTADGFLRPCLGNHGEVDLKPALRPRVNEEALADLFRQTLAEKPEAHSMLEQYTPLRIMTAIGG
ncbi:MAG: GTP 3',8-cyclase MoaA [Phycisphaerae bacterium]|nr:GTP 3',8-cyclase MoaA [Phycisphaerae bacterium]